MNRALYVVYGVSSMENDNRKTARPLRPVVIFQLSHANGVFASSNRILHRTYNI